jgi:SAM-dependent methyltransferase
VRDLSYRDPDTDVVRDDLARRYLRGDGLEIGALHRPLRLPPGTTVRYVDRLTADELRRRYPEYAAQWMVQPSVIDDSATLTTVPDASVDFLVANHVLEHMEDPIATLRTWLRVVRPGGVLSLAVPDKRRTFDALRPSTPIEHLERDFADGPAWSRSGHYEEYARLAEQVPEDEVAARAATLQADVVDIHFHVWDRTELLDFLVHLVTVHRLPFDIEVVQANGLETLLVLRRLG